MKLIKILLCITVASVLTVGCSKEPEKSVEKTEEAKTEANVSEDKVEAAKATTSSEGYGAEPTEAEMLESARRIIKAVEQSQGIKMEVHSIKNFGCKKYLEVRGVFACDIEMEVSMPNMGKDKKRDITYFKKIDGVWKGMNKGELNRLKKQQ